MSLGSFVIRWKSLVGNEQASFFKNGNRVYRNHFCNFLHDWRKLLNRGITPKILISWANAYGNGIYSRMSKIAPIQFARQSTQFSQMGLIVLGNIVFRNFECLKKVR